MFKKTQKIELTRMQEVQDKYISDLQKESEAVFEAIKVTDDPFTLRRLQEDRMVLEMSIYNVRMFAMLLQDEAA